MAMLIEPDRLDNHLPSNTANRWLDKALRAVPLPSGFMARMSLLSLLRQAKVSVLGMIPISGLPGEFALVNSVPTKRPPARIRLVSRISRPRRDDLCPTQLEYSLGLVVNDELLFLPVGSAYLRDE